VEEQIIIQIKSKLNIITKPIIIEDKAINQKKNI